MPNSDYEKFKKILEQGGNLDCERFFLENNHNLELCYCKILKEELAVAKELIDPKRSARESWASGLIEFVELKAEFIPSYLQLRNFLELDLQILLNAKKAKYIENVLRYVDYFNTINLECFKFVGRFLLNNSYDTLALMYFEKAKNAFFQDPELHLMLANYYLKIGENDLAKKEVDETILILPNYFPARKLKARLLK